MAQRYGTVLVFDECMTESDIRQAMKKIEFALAENHFIEYTDETYRNYKKVPYSLQEFDDQYGGPVWYIP